MMEGGMRWVPDFCSNVKRDHMVEGASACAEGTVVNRIMGAIQSHHVGLVRAGIRIKIMGRTDLRVKWSIEDGQCFVLEQQVVVKIPAEAVRLEGGIFRRSKQRLNRWIGRIVFVESIHSGTIFTIKIHGEDLTLKAYGPVIGARQPSKVWDVVNVVVDPQNVDLSIVHREPKCNGDYHVLG
jgi:hypothetical protein